MPDVVNLDNITRLDIPVERILAAAQEAGLESVVVIGYCEDGEEYFASSFADGGDVVWLMERAKLKLLRVIDER